MAKNSLGAFWTYTRDTYIGCASTQEKYISSRGNPFVAIMDKKINKIAYREIDDEARRGKGKKTYCFYR